MELMNSRLNKNANESSHILSPTGSERTNEDNNESFEDAERHVRSSAVSDDALLRSKRNEAVRIYASLP